MSFKNVASHDGRMTTSFILRNTQGVFFSDKLSMGFSTIKNPFSLMCSAHLVQHLQLGFLYITISCPLEMASLLLGVELLPFVQETLNNNRIKIIKTFISAPLWWVNFIFAPPLLFYQCVDNRYNKKCENCS